jgi:photosystem II stability/assembly factor-like uncharacterized protein
LRVGPSYEAIPGVDPGLVSMVALGEDGVLFPSSLWQSKDSGTTWREIQPPALHGLEGAWVVVLRDGRLLVNAARESGAQETPAGLYLSTDDRWTTFHRVTIDNPPARGYFLGHTAFAVDEEGSDAVFALSDYGAYVSLDGGSTWKPTPTR